ncbi:hypothetical protein ACHAXR_011808 [Thalassiosira sp. AJA248-18]
MAPLNWPNTITPRHHQHHHHIRKRAEAYASALYYSECSLRGISPEGAAAAEETARSKHSKWWLQGDDPNHPTLQEGYGAAEKKVAVADEKNPKPNNDELDLDFDAECNDDDDGSTRTDDDENHSVQDQDNINELQPIDLDLLDEDSVPIMARDDDLGTSFGSLRSFCTSHNASPYGASPHVVVSTQSPLLPPWLMSAQNNNTAALSSSSPRPSQPQEVFKQEAIVGSTEEMLKSYSSYPNQFMTSTQSSPTLPKPLLGITHQVTSESEADTESIYSSGSSSTSRSSSRKRVRGEGIRDFSTPLDQTYLDARIHAAKTELISRVESEGTKSPAFRKALASLEKFAKLKKSANNKKRRLSASTSTTTQEEVATATTTNNPVDTTNIDGTWHMISPPEYPSNLGKNANGDRLFTLGRMAFDMYQPSDLVCSIQTQYNTITSVEKKDLPLYVPKSLRREVDNERSGGCGNGGKLKTYNIIASFTIEPTNETQGTEDVAGQPKTPLRGIMTNYGYALPDPSLPDRKSVWFTGGTIEPADDDSLDEWIKIFGKGVTSMSSEDSSLKSDGDNDSSADIKSQSDIEAVKARTLASKILLGAVHEPIDNNGTVGFHLNKPIGGHGSAYVDIVYMDDEVRVMRGHSGSIYVFKSV